MSDPITAAAMGSLRESDLIEPESNGADDKSETSSPPALASEPRILDRFEEMLPAVGLVGEDSSAKLVNLAVVSRVSNRPNNVVVKGVSSSGKSEVVKAVLKFHPPSAYLDLTSSSPLGLAYMKEPLKHRVVVLYEAHSLTDDNAGAYIVRSLLSEQQIRHQTVIKGKPVLIEKEGPTGLITTTTKLDLFGENETRMLSVTVDDSREQTRRILDAIGRAAERGEHDLPDLSEWHQLYRWLETGERRVLIPFGSALMRLVEEVSTRLRRDAHQVIALIQAHALLHRASRPRDERGRIQATLEDYAVIREIVGPLIAHAAGVSVPETVKETAEAVRKLLPDYPDGVTLKALSKALKLDRSTVSRRANRAEAMGFIENQEHRERQTYRYEMGDPLPEASELLPTVDDLQNALDSHFPAQGATDAQEGPERKSAQGAHIEETLAEQEEHGDSCTCATCATEGNVVQSLPAQEAHKTASNGHLQKALTKAERDSWKRVSLDEAQPCEICELPCAARYPDGSFKHPLCVAKTAGAFA